MNKCVYVCTCTVCMPTYLYCTVYACVFLCMSVHVVCTVYVYIYVHTHTVYVHVYICVLPADTVEGDHFEDVIKKQRGTI